MVCLAKHEIKPLLFYNSYRLSEVSFMPKSLCKWKKKDIEKDIHELIHIVDKPRFICKDCARAAHDKGFLCKAIKLK